MRRLLLALILLLTLCPAARCQGVYVEKDLQEVTVKPKRQRYKRKGNPAVELMRKVIAAKADHNLENNDFVRYYKYQRITFAHDNISQRAKDSMAIFQKPLLKRQIEYCPQTGKYILPVSYNETITQHLYRREPHKVRDYVLGTNSEGLADLFAEGDMINEVTKSVFTDVNIYDDVITLLQRKFTSPLSSRAAISFFQFFILDTCEVDHQRVIRMNFVPQNPQDFGFSGYINILADSTYRVQQCSLRLPLRSSVNYISNLVLEQRFDDLPNGQRVLTNDDLFIEFGLFKKQKSLMLHRATHYSEISTDSIANIMFLPGQRRQGSTNVEDEAFWARHRTDTLTTGEANLKQTAAEMQARALRSVPIFMMRAFLSNYLPTNRDQRKSKFDIGPIMSTVSSNFIDGVRLRIGGQTTANLHPQLFLKGYAAYGTKNHRWYGMAEVEYSLLRKQYSPLEYPRHSIAAQVQSDVFSPADIMWQTGRDKDNVWISFRTQTIDHMMFQRHWLARYEVETNNHLDFKMQWKSSRMTPTGALYYRRLDGEMVNHLNATELLLSLRWAPGEEVINTKQRRYVTNRNNPVFSLTHTFGLKGVCGGDYRFNVTELTAYERVWLNSYGRIDLSLRAAAQWTRVPFPHLLMPTANCSYFIEPEMFYMVRNMEFVNDRYLSFMVEWDLSGKILNRIPLMKKLKWREVIGFRSLYGRLTQKNDPSRTPYAQALQAGFPPDGLYGGDLFEMPSRYGQTIVHPMGSTPYMEFSVGLHNIFKIIRIDYVRRLNYLNYPEVKKHGFRFALIFDF